MQRTSLLMSAAGEGLNLTGGSSGEPAVFGILTVSDRASQGVYEDASGPAILGFFQEAVKSKYVSRLLKMQFICMQCQPPGKIYIYIYCSPSCTGGVQCTRSFLMNKQ